MKIGEVCLLTNDALRLSNFYKMSFNIENHSTDDVHQFIIAEETTLTVYNGASDGTMARRFLKARSSATVMLHSKPKRQYKGIEFTDREKL